MESKLKNQDITLVDEKKDSAPENAFDSVYGSPFAAVFEPEGLLSSGQIICLIARLLKAINPRLGKTCMQTAYIATKIALPGKNDDRLSLTNILLLSILHLNGFYHFIGEDLVHRKDFTAEEVNRAYTYCYYYLKEMTPLSSEAETVLFYNKRYSSAIAKKVPQMEYASLIFLAQSLSELISLKGENYDESDFQLFGFERFNPHYVNIFKKIDSSRVISKALTDDSYEEELFKWLKTLKFNKEETKQLLRLLIYIMDFKSTQTVQHTIHAASYAVVLGKYAGCSDSEMNQLFTAGILHDLGKMSIPVSILESPEANLPKWQFRLLKNHVFETEKILNSLVSKNIFDIAVRHHEKLDGSGYPNHLTEKDLTPLQRILTIADILSALKDKRSYKNPYSEEQIKAIIHENIEGGKIDGTYARCIFERYEDVQTECMMVESSLMAPLGLVEIQFQDDINNIQAI